jgi:hypothetical protein
MQVALTKAASTLAQVELLMVAISGGSDGLLTTASHQGAEYRYDSSSEKRSSYSFSFTSSTNIIAISVLVICNSHFLDERLFDLHFLDNDFHFFGQPMWLAHKERCCDLHVNEYTA